MSNFHLPAYSLEFPVAQGSFNKKDGAGSCTGRPWHPLGFSRDWSSALLLSGSFFICAIGKKENASPTLICLSTEWGNFNVAYCTAFLLVP